MSLDFAPAFWIQAGMLVPAAACDLSDAAALINMSYRGEAARQGWANENDYIAGERISAAELARDLEARPNARLMLLRETAGGPPLGCFWIEPLDDGRWYFGLLAVRPDLQDRRLGRSLIGQAEAMAREGGARAVRMTVVRIRDTLIAWYQRRGYVLTGETEPFPQPELALGELHLVVLEKPL
jgi:ribosomal protein S18 acetylase RimI-like enzyme